MAIPAPPCSICTVTTERDASHLKRGIDYLVQGLKNTISQSIADRIEIKLGKTRCPFQCTVSPVIYTHGYYKRIYIWSLFFFDNMLNLMCRSSNVSVSALHIWEWEEDALKIYFAHMKNDQGGDQPRDPRHVYANPKMPEICPITALGASTGSCLDLVTAIFVSWSPINTNAENF
jgi:hypothetical protein